MRVFQYNRFLSVIICIIALGIASLATAQVSSTEQAVMDKILKLKKGIDELMMKPGSSSDKTAMDKMLEMKRDMDTFLGLLPPHLQKEVQKKNGTVCWTDIRWPSRGRRNFRRREPAICNGPTGSPADRDVLDAIPVDYLEADRQCTPTERGCESQCAGAMDAVH